MDRSPSLNVTPKLVLGVLILAVGVIFTLDTLGVVDSGDILAYWPLGLVALGVAKVLQPYGRGFGILLILLGAWLLLERLEVIPWRLWDFWPLLLVAVGASLIWRAVAPRPRRGDVGTGPQVNVVALLGSAEPRITGDNLRGGEVMAILGSCKLDLRQATIAPGGAVIDTFAFMGGIEMLVPEDWAVEIRGTPIMGAFEDKTRAASPSTAARLTVTGTLIMGGVEIKN